MGSGAYFNAEKILETTIAVSTLTTIMAYTNIRNAGGLYIAVENQDSTDTVTVYVTPSNFGTYEHQEPLSFTVSPQKENDLEIGPSQMRGNVKITAQTESPGFPSATIKVAVYKLPRLT